ncbi:MAG TPA: tetratricopeptide repeat protein [Drouetiella sp.]
MHSPASITSGPARSGADFLLSVMYQTGYRVPKDMERAWSLCRRAATKGDTHAQMTLKTIIERSDRSNPFFQSSLEWFVKSEQCDVPEGWHHAAVVLATEETEENVDQILLLYKRASRSGYLPSINNLALYLARQGRYREAYRHFERAACAGYKLSQFNLLLMHLDGTAPDCNPTESYKRLEQLAFDLFAPAQHKLAELYLSGAIVRKNYRLAHKYFTLAAAQGYAASRLSLVELRLDRESPFFNDEAAFFECAKLAMESMPVAQFLLAQLCHCGRGTKKDSDMALFWCTLAAENGLAEARTWLRENDYLSRN